MNCRLSLEALSCGLHEIRDRASNNNFAVSVHLRPEHDTVEDARLKMPRGIQVIVSGRHEGEAPFSKDDTDVRFTPFEMFRRLWV